MKIHAHFVLATTLLSLGCARSDDIYALPMDFDFPAGDPPDSAGDGNGDNNGDTPAYMCPRPCDDGLQYDGSTHTLGDCVAAGGEVVAVAGDPGGTEVCRFIAAHAQSSAQCPSDWSQADQWSEDAGYTCTSPCNQWPEPTYFVGGVPSTQISIWCDAGDCRSPFAMGSAGHPWDNMAPNVTNSSGSSGAQSPQIKMQWDGSHFIEVDICPAGDCGAHTTMGYAWIRGRLVSIGCK